jgi:isopenicillin N synthase-like dioxygenase
MSPQTIPTLDLQDFLADAPRRSTFVAEMGTALATIGFFALINHGVDAQLIAQAYAVTQAFFELPEAVKLTYTNPQLKGQRGFTRFGQEHAKDHPVPDLKEFWHVGREAALPNLQPLEVPSFHPVMLALYEQLEVCAAHLLAACALYLGEPPDRLPAMVRSGDTILRLIHYPPIPEDAAPTSLRAAAHEDINLITLLCEATADGLELLQRDGTWLTIPALPGQIIVDSGDMLQQLTNGWLKSTTHRVSNPYNERDRRFSIPFFVHPRAEVDLTPWPSCIARTGGVAKFPPITAGAYLHQRLREIGLA